MMPRMSVASPNLTTLKPPLGRKTLRVDLSGACAMTRQSAWDGGWDDPDLSPPPPETLASEDKKLSAPSSLL